MTSDQQLHKKKIMIITDNRRSAQRLKFELEIRKVYDVVDTHTSSPRKLLEQLIVNKDKEQYDYRMFIIDQAIDSPDFSLSEHLKRKYPMAHLLLWCGYQKPKLWTILGAICFTTITSLV